MSISNELESFIASVSFQTSGILVELEDNNSALILKSDPTGKATTLHLYS